MSYDVRGVSIERDDAVVWFGRIGRTRPALHLGVVGGFGWLGKVRVDLVRHGEEGDWLTTGVVIHMKPHDLMVIEDAPESPDE